MKRIASIIIAAVLGLAVPMSAQDYNFTDNQLCFAQIVGQWHDKCFYTADFSDKPDITACLLSLAQAYPNDVLALNVVRAMGYDPEGRLHNFVLDKQAGYFSSETLTELEGRVQICLWRCTDGSTLVAVALTGDEYQMEGIDNRYLEHYPDWPAVNYNDLMFFRVARDEAILMPHSPQELCGRAFNFHRYRIELPRHGKDIKLIGKDDPAQVVTLRWNDGRFAVAR